MEKTLRVLNRMVRDRVIDAYADIEGWAVQFLPIFNPLLKEAVEEANEIRFKRTKTRVMTAEHLVAIMLQTGRPKDFGRIHQFMEQDVVNSAALSGILERLGLIEAV